MDTIERDTGKAHLRFGAVLHAYVEHGIVQRAAHEKLETEVVDSLAVRKRLPLLSSIPLKDQTVAKGQTGG